MLPARRRRHGVDPGNELRNHQCGFAAFVEGLRRAQNAGLGIDRHTAQESQQQPAHVPSQPELHRVAQQQSHDCCQQNVRTPQRVRRHCRARRHQSDRGRKGKPDRFGQQQAEGQGIPVACHQQIQIHRQSLDKENQERVQYKQSRTHVRWTTSGFVTGSACSKRDSPRAGLKDSGHHSKYRALHGSARH